MRILITGINGFVGRLLSDELAESGHEPVGFDLSADTKPDSAAEVLKVDLTCADDVADAVEALQPDACIHLGGIASPPIGHSHPELMLNTNILGTANILEALRKHAEQARMLFASTAYVYGNVETDNAIDEDTALRPIGVYAVSKAAADLMTLAYSFDYGMDTMSARACNHTGPGQSSDFVIPAFAQRIKDLKTSKDGVMHVGNLDSERLFLDVRDVVRAYRLLIEKGQRGVAYNVASKRRIAIREILDRLCAEAGIKPSLEVDPAFYRPTDRSPMLSIDRISADTGWSPEIPLEQTLRDVFESINQG
jgi:GDP-4-dehydro-6-deoxy-D-mannose reductase